MGACRVVLATSATPFQADPVAADMGFDAVLCTRPKVQAGMLTGDVDGDVLWGPGKARAVTGYAHREGIRLAGSFAYSNGTEDVPLLKAVGHPRPLNPEPGLVDVAYTRGWPIVRLEPPRRGFALVPALRTGWALTALGTSVWLGAGVGLLNHSRQAGANVGAGAGSDIALALGGVTLKVTGEQNLWSDRPAVLMFNHQSSLDMLVFGDLLRRDFTGVAKKELARDPRFAPIGWLADIAYIDRGNTQKAKQGLQPAVSKLRYGFSIWTGRNPLAHPEARPVQEGRLPHRHPGGRADRPGRHPQHRGAHVAQLILAAPGHRGRRGAGTRPDVRLDRRQSGRPHRVRPPAFPRHAGQLAGRHTREITARAPGSLCPAKARALADLVFDTVARPLPGTR